MSSLDTADAYYATLEYELVQKDWAKFDEERSKRKQLKQGLAPPFSRREDRKAYWRDKRKYHERRKYAGIAAGVGGAGVATVGAADLALGEAIYGEHVPNPNFRRGAGMVGLGLTGAALAGAYAQHHSKKKATAQGARTRMKRTDAAKKRVKKSIESPFIAKAVGTNNRMAGAKQSESDMQAGAMQQATEMLAPQVASQVMQMQQEAMQQFQQEQMQLSMMGQSMNNNYATGPGRQGTYEMGPQIQQPRMPNIRQLSAPSGPSGPTVGPQ